MAYHRRPNKSCLVCGTLFPPNRNVVTCGEDCRAKRKAEVLAQWRCENVAEQREKGRVRREENLERYRTNARNAQRIKRKSDPAKFSENRDPQAILERRRARYRRGQAARRARLKAADAPPSSK